MAWALVAALAADAYEPERATFAVRVEGEIVPYRVFAVYVMPGASVRIGGEGIASADLEVGDAAGLARRSGAGDWVWPAPERPGLHSLEVVRSATGETIRLNVFVLTPADRTRDGVLEGYRIGAYPQRPFRGLSVYRPPRGFVEVTPEVLDTPVSPHFTLGQFVCKQAGDYPKFLILRERLLLKLEFLLELVNRRGLAADSFVIMSGFRTPFYNESIGNVRYSRHQWGGAADIYIDESPRDGRMDDLDGNGRIDIEDARLLWRLFEEGSLHPDHRTFVGGLGLYGATAAHGPFVHVDARGYRVRWGD